MINSMDPDIMGICEYNPTFNTKGDNTAQLLFSSFPYCYIGKKYDYNCNSFFSRFPLYSCTQYSFPKCVQARYFSVASFTMKGNTIKFVETHLDFNQGSNGSSYRSSQMKELIDAFKDYPYVIICADFNSRIRDEYNIFLDAGFSLATDNLPNAGSPSTDTSQIIIDNIIVKGFRVKETKVYPHMSLSDHDLIWSRLVITD
jgi:endonuclease/exonuclease/phosphatase family metal-dependent hydrolase